MNTRQTTFSAVLGIVLTHLRKEFGVEQGDMAVRMGLSQASYSRLETGKAIFSVDQMYQAANALEISGEEISQRLNGTIENLKANNISVIAQVRGSTTQGKQEGPGVGHFVAGAALGALIFGILSQK